MRMAGNPRDFRELSPSSSTTTLGHLLFLGRTLFQSHLTLAFQRSFPFERLLRLNDSAALRVITEEIQKIGRAGPEPIMIGDYGLNGKGNFGTCAYTVELPDRGVPIHVCQMAYIAGLEVQYLIDIYGYFHLIMVQCHVWPLSQAYSLTIQSHTEP